MEIHVGSRRRSRWPRAVLFGGILGLSLLAVGSQLRTGAVPQLDVSMEPQAIGRDSKVELTARELVRGVVALRVTLEQAERQFVVEDQRWTPQPPWNPWADKEDQVRLEIDVGTGTWTGLTDGEALLRVRAEGAGTWFRPAPTAETQLELQVYVTPPSLVEGAGRTSVRQGGAGVVVYEVGSSASVHGVEVDQYFFRGYRDDRLGEGRAFCLFVAPHDHFSGEGFVLMAEDVVGNRSEVEFLDEFRGAPLDRDTIRITDGVMQKVVPRIMSRTEGLEDRGSLLENYLQINRDLRAALGQRLVELSRGSATGFVWEGSFVQMPAKVVSSFADRRTYVYRGKNIDQQDHLGFDLASVKQDAIPAANAGTVVLAEYFGIYGNTVVVDHGFGLMTLYAHMSRFDVAVGDAVARGQVLGRTGATGLALGDHLHFTTLIQGVPTNPLEWWDARWIRDHLKEPIGSLLSLDRDG